MFLNLLISIEAARRYWFLFALYTYIICIIQVKFQNRPFHLGASDHNDYSNYTFFLFFFFEINGNVVIWNIVKLVVFVFCRITAYAFNS